MENEAYYVGTDLKFALRINAQGFSQDEDDYDITLVCGNKKINITKDDIVRGEDNEHYLLVDTSQFSPGLVRAIVTAKVPDEDFPTGVRREVDRKDLCYIMKP